MVSMRLTAHLYGTRSIVKRREWPARMEIAASAALCLLLIVVGCLWIGRHHDAAAPAMTTEITVARGDTLWDIAQRYGDPDRYILRRVSDLERANGLRRGEVLREGQRLIVPSEFSQGRLYCGGAHEVTGNP